MDEKAVKMNGDELEGRVIKFDHAIRRIAHHVGACCAGVDVIDDNRCGSHTDKEIIKKIDSLLVEAKQQGFDMASKAAEAKIADLTARLEAKDASEPVAWAILDKWGKVDGGLIDGKHPPFPEDQMTGIQNWSPLFTTPQPTPTVKAAVDAALRRAAEVANEFCGDDINCVSVGIATNEYRPVDHVRTQSHQMEPVMTTREKLQAIVGGVEPVGCVDRPFTRWQGLHAPKEPGEEWKAKMVDMYTYDQILPMLEQAYRLALEDAANLCEDVGSRTAFLAEERLRRMAEQSGGEG